MINLEKGSYLEYCYNNYSMNSLEFYIDYIAADEDELAHFNINEKEWREGLKTALRMKRREIIKEEEEERKEFLKDKPAFVKRTLASNIIQFYNNDGIKINAHKVWNGYQIFVERDGTFVYDGMAETRSTNCKEIYYQYLDAKEYYTADQAV